MPKITIFGAKIQIILQIWHSKFFKNNGFLAHKILFTISIFFFFLKIVDISMKTSFQKVEQCASKWNKEVSWKGEESPWQPKHECSFYSLVVYQFMFSPLYMPKMYIHVQSKICLSVRKGTESKQEDFLKAFESAFSSFRLFLTEQFCKEFVKLFLPGVHK